MGIEQGAITNSPVDCLCDAATSVSEAIGTGVPRQIPITRSRKKTLSQDKVFFQLNPPFEVDEILLRNVKYA